MGMEARISFQSCEQSVAALWDSVGSQVNDGSIVGSHRGVLGTVACDGRGAVSARRPEAGPEAEESRVRSLKVVPERESTCGHDSERTSRCHSLRSVLQNSTASRAAVRPRYSRPSRP
jgi:hypothetical protein